MVDGGDMRSADIVSAAPRCPPYLPRSATVGKRFLLPQFRTVRSRLTRRGSTTVRRRSRPSPAHRSRPRPVARSPHRPGRPAASNLPWRTSPAWVNPAGISSQWWVTRTMVGHSGSAANPAEAGDQALPGAEVEPGRRLVEQEQLGSAHQRPGQEHLLAFALGDHAEGAVPDGADTRPGPAGGRPGPSPRPSTGATRSRAPRRDR